MDGPWLRAPLNQSLRLDVLRYGNDQANGPNSPQQRTDLGPLAFRRLKLLPNYLCGAHEDEGPRGHGDKESLEGSTNHLLGNHAATHIHGTGASSGTDAMT